MTHLVGICGLKGSGKDTSGDYLCSRYKFSKGSFADPIKKAVRDIFGFPEEQLWGSSELRDKIPDDIRLKFSGLDPVDGSALTCIGESEYSFWKRESDGEIFPEYITPRLALVTLGTEWGRRLHSEIWIRAFIRQAPRGRVVLTDVRYANEIRMIQQHGGKVIRLTRGVRISNHPSEKELESIPLDTFDFVVNNTSSKDFLFQSLDSVMMAIGVEPCL